MNLKTEAFLSGLLLVLLFLLPVQWFYAQITVSLWINQAGNAWLDKFFLLVTYLGDGWFVVALSILIWFKDKKLGLALLIAYLLSSGLAQLAKHLLFDEWHRPMWFAYHQHIQGIRVIEGAEETYRNSFPSGHSTAAFAMFATFSFYVSDRRLKLLCLFLALLTAFSRIYLFQHFLRDTWAGAILGTSVALLVYAVIMQLPWIQKLMKKNEN